MIVDVQGFSALSQGKSEISSALSQLSSVNVINRENEMLLSSTILAEPHDHPWNQTVSVLTQRISLLEAVNPSCESRIFFLPFFFSFLTG